MFRFIDDLTVLDDGGGLSRFLKGYIPLNLYSRRKIKATARDQFQICLLKLRTINFPPICFIKSRIMEK